MSIALDGNGNRVPRAAFVKQGSPVLTESERIVQSLYDCEISRVSTFVTLRVPGYLWTRLVEEAKKLNLE